MNTVNQHHVLINFLCYDSPKLQWDLKRLNLGTDSFLDQFETRKGELRWTDAQVDRVRSRYCEWSFSTILSQCEQHDVTLIDYDMECYPEQLRQIHDPPLVLYTKGILELLRFPRLAVVGPRKASAYAIDVTRTFCEVLSHYFCIVSGLAEGIDTQAHRIALEQGGTTIAVVGNGLDYCYPSSNRSLMTHISSEGLLLSEFPLGVSGRPFHFPQRNRIVSGLSAGVLLSEAGLKSGSLITARLAMEQGRTVFAVPGSIFSENSKGVHALINDGATLVVAAQDILDELSLTQPIFELIETPSQLMIPQDEISEDQRRILALLKGSEIEVDAISSQLDIAISDVLSSIAFFEYKEWILRDSSDHVRLNPKWSLQND
jgi:DNA processing protein